MEGVLALLGVILVLIWFLVGTFKNRLVEAEKEIEEKAELDEEARAARDRYRNDAEFRDRVHQHYNE